MLNRLWNKTYANMFGYFWIPCPACGQEFGGHEWKTGNKYSSLPMGGGKGKGICPDCTDAGVGERAWNNFYKTGLTDPRASDTL